MHLWFSGQNDNNHDPKKRNETIRRRRRDETRLHIFVLCVWFASTIRMHTCDNDQADKRNGL